MSLLEFVDLLVLNGHEAQQLTGFTLADEAAWADLADRIHSLGPRSAVVTLRRWERACSRVARVGNGLPRFPWRPWTPPAAVTRWLPLARGQSSDAERAEFEAWMRRHQ